MLKKINIIVLVLVCIIYCFLNDTLALSYNSKMWIEDPVVGSENYEKLKVRGWALSEDKDSQVMIYIDGKRTEGKINRSERNDVTNKISGYGGKESNPMPGFESTVDISGYKSGTHQLRVDLISKSGEILNSKVTSFRVKKATSKMWVEDPVVGSENYEKLKVRGWALSEDKDSQVMIYIDGKRTEGKINRSERNDVTNKISGYGGKESNPMPGFESTVDISGYKSGTHQLRVDLISKSGEILNSKVTSFRVRKATSKMWLETPNIDSIYRVNVNIEGWALSEDSRDRVQIEINGKVISNDVGRLKRDDVLAKINGYGEKSKNPTPGFSYILDVSDYDVGDYMLTVKLIDSHDQILIQTSRKIKIAGKPIKGIDVSAYQKTIDWKKVKNSGIEFAMIRLSTHRNGKMQKDPYFDYNVKEAKKYGVAIGAYLYSYAGNESEAIKEAEFAYSILKNYPKTFTFPIAFDIEDPNIHANLSSSQRTLISKAFCERLNSKGYYTTIYSYRSYLDKFDFNFLKGNDYWVAEWNKTCNFKQEYGMWQYTSNGKVDGITGRVDMNYAYINYPKYIKEKHLNHL